MAHFLWDKTMQVNIYGHDERNDELLNVFHVLSTDTVEETTVTNVATLVANWVDNHYKNCYALNVSSDRVVVTDVSTIGGDQAEIPQPSSGTMVGATLPSQNTLAVKKSTGKAGRANRGDWYVWPTVSAQLEILDGNLFLDSYRATCVSELNTLLDALESRGFSMVVASKATGLTRVVKTFVAVDRLVDSQNRRGGGRGR